MDRATIGGKTRVRTFLLATCTMLTFAGTALAQDATSSPPGSEWRRYNGEYDGQRFSPLDQITPQDAGRLGETCRMQLAEGGPLHSGPLMIDNTLFVTTAHDTFAIDAGDCKLRWRYTDKPQQQDVWPTNRGVAYMDGRLFRGTPDGRLLALDAKTGALIWKHDIADPQQGEFVSASPTAWEGLIIVGTAGSDWGVRGRVMAFDAATGREVWRFYTIPRGNEPGADTWKQPNTARYGGGGTWTSYTIDPASGEVFVSVGNPAPDFAPSYRPGENLYTDSMVVLDARTGALKWYYQLSPHDGHDLDLAAAPVLYNGANGRRMVAVAGKNGYAYGIDRDTHQLVFRTPITTIENEGAEVTPAGVHACPGWLGGTEWNGPAYDAVSNSLIIPSVDWCGTFTAEKPNYVAGQFYTAGVFKPDQKKGGWLTALDPDTGAIRWRYHSDSPMVAGVTPTAGKVTLTGDMEGNLLVFDSGSGKLLKKIDTGGSIAGGVITYEVAGKQYVASTSGNASRLTFGENGKPSIVVYTVAPASNKQASVGPAH